MLCTVCRRTLKGKLWSWQQYFYSDNHVFIFSGPLDLRIRNKHWVASLAAFPSVWDRFQHPARPVRYLSSFYPSLLLLHLYTQATERGVTRWTSGSTATLRHWFVRCQKPCEGPLSNASVLLVGENMTKRFICPGRRRAGKADSEASWHAGAG